MDRRRAGLPARPNRQSCLDYTRSAPGPGGTSNLESPERRTWNAKPEAEGVLPNSSQPSSGLGFRPTRETSAVRSHAKPQRTQRGLPGSEPVAVVAGVAWNRFCTSRRDGRKLRGAKRLRQHAPETRNPRPVVGSHRSHESHSSQAVSHGGSGRFPFPCPSRIPSAERCGERATAATSVRDHPPAVSGCSVGVQRQCSVGVQRQCAASVRERPVSDPRAQSPGVSCACCTIPMDRRRAGLPARQTQQAKLPGLLPLRSRPTWNRFCTSRRDGRKLGGRKDFGNTSPKCEVRVRYRYEFRVSSFRVASSRNPKTATRNP